MLPNFRAITNTMLALMLCMLFLASDAVTQTPEWSDGSPIVRFDKHEEATTELVASWEGVPERHWAGPAIWANRLQDWVVRDGALVCEPMNNAPCRTVHLLTYDLGGKQEPFRLATVIIT